MSCSSNKYPLLFSPLKVNKVVLKNRIISAPLGSLTDKSISGIGMIIRGTSGSVPDERARMAYGPYCFENMNLSSKVREQVSVIRQRGAKAEFELCHVGQYAKVKQGDYAIGPVAFTREDGIEVKAMDEAMMDDIANKFAQGALDAKAYGFDMVMLHFAHGWLPAQFLSPYFNKRTDEYGGSFVNRIKFPTMIVDRVREAVGPDFALDMRISGYEHVEGAMDPDEVVAFVKSIEDKIDMVHISCGLEQNLETMGHMSTSAYQPHKYNIEWSKKMKESVNIPVAVVGAIMTPEEGEEILASGAADAVVIGRQVIADPFWVSKAWEERSEDIVPCLRCLNCYNSYQQGKESKSGMKNVPNCAVNPRYLHEDRVPVELEKAKKKKKVVVIGGGPAGMKAALTANERGHEVHIFEKEKYFGGQLQCSEYDKMKQDLKRYKDYLITQINKSDIQVHLGKEVTPDRLEELKADTVICALGASPIVPKIPGIERDFVYTAVDMYKHLEKAKDKVVVIGGGSIGCEMALHFGLEGKDVTVIELSDNLVANANQHVQIGLLQKLKALDNIKVLKNTQCKSIGDYKVTVADKDNNEYSIETDTVVIATGMKSNLDEANKFYGYVQDTSVIGDANRVGTVWEATHDGYFISQKL